MSTTKAKGNRRRKKQNNTTLTLRLADVDDSTVVLEDVDFLNTVDGVHAHLLQDTAQLLVI